MKLDKDNLPAHRVTRAYTKDQKVAIHVSNQGVMTIADFLVGSQTAVKLTKDQLLWLAADLTRTANIMID